MIDRFKTNVAAVDHDEYNLLRLAVSKGGGVAGGDGFNGCYADVKDSVAERLRARGLFVYRGFDEWWGWSLTEAGRAAVAEYEEEQVRRRQLFLPGLHTPTLAASN